MAKYFKLGIVIIILMCLMFQAVSAENGEVEISVCIIWGIVAGIAGAGILTLIEVRKHKPVAKARNADYYIKDGDAVMSVNEDRYLRSSEVRTKINTNNTNKK